MLMRLFSSSSAALIVTSALLLVMAGFVARQQGPRLTTRRVEFAPFIVERPPPLRPIERQRPQDPDPLADPPPRPHSGPGTTGIPVIDVTPGPIAPPDRFDRGGFGLSDGDLLPIVTVAPVYPRSAATRGLEGFVTVSFRVTANGSVENVQVFESSHTVFERAAVDAAYKFRFRPRVIGGEPVAVDGVRRRIVFTLED